MALKFAVTQRASVPSVVCSEEALIESIEDVAAAAEALYDAGADGAELCQVMDNLNLALEAINNGGLTPELVSTFNSEGELSACCGLESLTVEGLEAMGEKQVSSLEAKYVAGLEGKIAEYWAKFVAWLKNMWAKLVNWFKAIFVNRARYCSALAAVKNLTDAEFNGEAKVAAINMTGNLPGKMLALEKEILAALSKAETGAEIDKAACDKAIKELSDIMDKDRKEASVKTLVGDVNSFKKQVADYIEVAKGKEMQATSKKLDAMLKKLIDEAGKAANMKDETEAAAKKDEINKKRDAIVYAMGIVRADNKYIMKLGGQYLKIFKAAQSAKKAK